MGYSRRYMNTNKNRLSDRDILLDLLMTEKHISQVYNTAIMESENSRVIETFEEMQNDEHDNAMRIFSAMKERNWYNPEKAQTSSERHGKQYVNKFNSDYAVTSGARHFGGRLSYHHQ